ncbi:glycosyltransferase family A protein [Bacteroides helcogenes]|uniref:Glycosyl transferase family 2 n=1 Tax=Bacteroides helcogenes (strain ATCC 35417 / DSM 20613 / JCM 6297 / CCUG 15421 / P 36-108) TaxID=693979 RepID=E6SQT1_BACT6|nr:glycosyltransferase family A protein [Bacteroides helcogenes]ADV44014.1 glycosyl transferase family 2 [Bacteroides helcogenes P 36-108]MDY5237838.1 glycosyltransferase family A protein [Bacteroides helcogenes]
MNTINYSIIIPHKNIPQLLQRCLDSIPQREDIQIIVVDDDSSPEVVDFSNFPGQDRAGVELLFTKEGKGAGYARNCGLARAKGKWLLFADADDYFLPDFMNVLDAYRDTDYDLITFRAESAGSDTLEPLPPRQLNYDKIAEDMDLEILKFRNDVPWAKMVSARLVRDHRICFDETIAANDAMFSAKVDYHARKVAACSKSVYCATVRGDSLQYAVKLESLLARVEVACRLNRFLKNIGRADKTVYSYRRVMDCRKHFGRRGYRRAMAIYLRRERLENISKTLLDLLKCKFRKFFCFANVK